VIPIGFYWNGNQIVVCTAATAPKVQALSSRPNVAMSSTSATRPTEAKALLLGVVSTARCAPYIWALAEDVPLADPLSAGGRASIWASRHGCGYQLAVDQGMTWQDKVLGDTPVPV
jgi:hypothetical protein